MQQVDSAGDLFDQDDPPEIKDDQDNQPVTTKPIKPHLKKSKSVCSLQELDSTLPLEPSHIRTDISGIDVSVLPQWLGGALLGKEGAIAQGVTYAAEGPQLITRLPALAQRMRSLLRGQLYGRGSGVGEWSGKGRPAGFLGAGLAEEMCSAVFARIQSLRAKGVVKQVCLSSYPTREVL